MPTTSASPQHQSPSDARLSSEESDTPIRRTRVSMACMRCRARKQKCDGAPQSCFTCRRLGVKCYYKPRDLPTNEEKRLYVTALELRVAELETLVSSLGYDHATGDHLVRSRVEGTPDTGPGRDLPAPPRLQDGADPEVLADAIRNLISSANGNEVPTSSKISLTRIMGSIIKRRPLAKPNDRTIHVDGTVGSERIRSLASRQELASTMGAMFVSDAMATRLLDGWLKHLVVRHPVIHSPRLLDLHARRDNLSNWEQSILHLIYANSGRYLEACGETGPFLAEQHFDAAVESMDEMLSLQDTRSVLYLFLMALYSLRTPGEPGAWNLAGLTMRLCVELGLHRGHESGKTSLQKELNKRIFWASFYLDREISSALSRPAAIADKDIDVELPLDVDENVDDPAILEEAAKKNLDGPASPPTSLTIFIHFMRLKRIQGRIDTVMYRAGQHVPVPTSIVEGILGELSSWKQSIPEEYYRLDKVTNEPLYGIDIFLISYYRSVRSLLYPQLLVTSVDENYLRLCVEASAGVCQGYKRLHRRFQSGYSPVSLQSIFLAGLTMLYCIWLSSDLLPSISEPLTDCNIMLYVMTERWPDGRKYRDVLEKLQGIVLDAVKRKNGHSPYTGTDASVPIWDRNLNLSSFHRGERSEITRMIVNMVGDGITIGTSNESSPAATGTLTTQTPGIGADQVWGPSYAHTEGSVGGGGGVYGLNVEWDTTMLDEMGLNYDSTV